MPRDYKNVNKNQKKNKGRAWVAPVMTFLTGLSFGLFIAFAAFLYYQNYSTEHPEQNRDVAESTDTGAEESKQSLPRPKFEFYNVLPNREVNISEWVAEEQDRESAEINGQSIYVLQVGSFNKHSAADQMKAQLALMGINSNIQRVVINGQDVRHRVRIGPYKNTVELNKARQRLRENNLDFMVLKLEDLEATGN